MSDRLDVYYTLSSTWSFLAWDRLGALVDRHGLAVHYYPVDFSKVFAQTGGLPLKQRAPARQAYRLVELRRWRAHLCLQLNLEPRFFPVVDDEATHLVLVARELGLDVWTLSRAFMAAIWQEERDIADADTRAAIVEEQGFDLEVLQPRAPTMATVRANESAQAVGRGVFGAPSFVFRGELFWGQDRLDFVERAIAA
ncbi:MAG: 2-hydroxychromene-2-carboxylate isomerase [Pseudomonadota bacterium]